MKTLAVLLLAMFAAGSAWAEEKPEKLAQAEAERWLALIDAGKFDESWRSAAAYFQGAISMEQWQASLQAARVPLGALGSRTFKHATHEKKLPGAPDGDYYVIKFTTSFANKKEAVETITPMKEKDGAWKVSGYFIR